MQVFYSSPLIFPFLLDTPCNSNHPIYLTDEWGTLQPKHHEMTEHMAPNNGQMRMEAVY